MEGNHTSEVTTIEIGEKKISVIGIGIEKSSIGTGALSSTGALFSATTGQLGLLHMKVDCNSNASPSPSVVVVSDGSGSLSLEDVVITTSNIGEYMISSSVFVVPLLQLSMVGVEIKNMNVSKSLFSEPALSSSSSSSSALFLTATSSGESTLANLTVTNVKLTEGDGVAVAKSVAEGETFVVQNVTIEDCECESGSGGGIKVELKTDASKLQIERTTTMNRCTSGKYGGGMVLNLADNSIDFSIVSVDFSGCSASLGGNYVFVNGSNSASWGITTEKLNIQHDSSKYNELVGYDRSDTTMGLFPLNVYLDRYPDAAHVGKGKDGLGGYNSWFCGFDYYPCATITHAAQVRYADTNKKIELDSGYELAEAIGMTDGNEWEISCARKGMEVGVKAPENFESSCLIEVLSKCSMRNIKFCIPSALSGASSSSLISSNSTLLTLTDCSVVCSSENSIGYCFVNVIGGKVKVEGLVITETLTFGEHSVIEFGEGVESVVVCGCEVSNIEKRNGDGGWVSGVVGAERDEGKNGIIVIESCVVKGCKCVGGRGGGMSVVVKGEGSVVVNGSCVIDGCEAKGSRESSEGRSEGRGGGMMIVMESRDGSMKMESGREGLFMFGEDNKASYGKDVFVGCGGGVLLESKVNRSSFSFFDWSVIPTDVVKLCGSEDGREEEVIPLFVYLCSIGTKLRVDGRGERALDQSHCGCSVSFGNDEMIGFNVICIEGGGVVVNGFAMEGGVRMSGKSPIVVSNGAELEMNHSRMSGVEVVGGIGGGGGGCLNVEMGVNGIVNVEECNLSSVCSGGSGMKGGGMKISVEKGGRLEMKNVKYSGCEVPREDVGDGGRGMGGGMFVKLADGTGTFVMEGMGFEGCNAWKGKNVFVSGWDLSEIANEEHLKWEIKEEELGSLDELCGWERKSTGEEGYVIPLVVYLWRNWSGNGFVSREKGGDFKSPKVVIEGTKKGTGVTISDEDENDLSDDGSMISSNVSLSFVNVSFTKPAITTNHEVLIESSGANTLLSVSDCSFGPGRGVAESFGYCVMRANGGSVVIEGCLLSLISELKGLIAFSPSAGEVTLQNVNISFADVTERSLISMMEEENQMNGEKKVFSNGNRPVLRVVGCSFANITNEGIGASVIDVGSFENGVECVMDECSMSSCKSGLSDEGGGMRVVLKSGESVLKVNGSSFSMCKCSSETGCGGGLFIDGSDPHANYGNESQIPPLKFKIVNILFVMNEAHVGKDIFVRCHSIAHQINETLFALNYNQESLNSNNSICGRDVWSEGDVDLIPLITFYYSAQVFVSGRGSDGRGCGAQSNPCVSINRGVEHIEEGVMNGILIDGEGFVRKECVIGDLVVNSLKKTQGIVRLNCKIEKSAEKDCVMEFVNECSVERCSFQFEDGFESTHRYLMKVKNGMTKIQECEFFSSPTTTVEDMKLNSSIVSVESGELKIFDSTFKDIHSTRSVLSFREESDVMIDETRMSNIECEGDVVSVGRKAKVEMKEMGVVNVTLLLEGCVIGMDEAEQDVSVLNSSFGRCGNSVDKGSMMQIRNSKNVRIEACSPKVVIEGTKKGTGVTISDEDENELSDGSMISSNVSLSFVNVSFTKPAITTHHSVLIESSGANTLLSVSDCSFGPGRGVAESFGYCVMRVNGGSVVIERCSLSLISELKGLIAFRTSAGEVTVQNVNISFADVTERSLISMIEEDNQMNGEKKVFSNGNRPILRVVGCSFANITNEGIGASVIDVGSFENGVECVMDECSMSSCKSGLSDEGGGMRVVLKSGESVLKVNGSSFSMCKCSSETGCGGGLFIDGSDPHANYGNESQIPPLNFKIVNILFVMNEAHVGKDVFVRCHSIEHQINETLFALNYNQESLNSNNSICGRDAWSEGDVDLIPLITFYYSAQVFVSGRGSDGRGCGAQSNPCVSINRGVEHIEEGVMNGILIDGEGFVRKECVIGDLVVNSLKKTQGIVRLNCKIEKSAEKDCVMEFVNECSVERCSFQFEDGFESTHRYLMKVKNGMTKIQECEFFSSPTTTVEDMKLNSSIVSVESGELKIFDSTFKDIHSTRSVLSFREESDVMIDETRMSNIECEGDVVSVGRKAKVEMKEMKVENVTLLLEGCVIGMEDAEQEVSVLNSSFGKCVNSVDKGSMMQIRNSKNVRIEACVKEGLCKWNGSLADVEKSNVEMRETTIMKSKGGGLWVSGGSLKIENGKFENNNASIEGYPSARRNVICEGNGELNVVSVKGGDGLLPNTSLWILDEGCELGGIAADRGSSFFIPILEEVKNTTQPNGNVELMIVGKLLLPCDLSVKMSMKNGDEEEIVRKGIEEDGFVSENEIHSFISCSEWEKVREETEVSVWIVFGKGDSPSSTERFIVKNKSESVVEGDERIVEGGKEGKSSWSAIIAIIFVILFLIVLIVSVIVTIRWRKVKNEAKDLREIV
eukprot:MONOS_15987.1-p1 / transcript=MONOS_15987.1 / gene=MONOS_15987 / organism=Monocercomonoides_exilis_PA203 / gene_product=unspecified product / transcript_product=unspecified product / location=Mono_scaffold01447:3-8803(-) / protein_length=2427 / sequence_SO=supercontig / SO=protein_coding / is_pseudo=false